VIPDITYPPSKRRGQELEVTMGREPRPKPLVGDAAPYVEIASRTQWRAWLSKNHDVFHAIWLVSYKTSTGRPRLDYGDLVDEALCFGWIDSTVRTIDDERAANYLSRRKKGSIWSRSNKQRIDRLVADGLMTPAGQALIDAAKADGSWTIYDPVEDLVVPPDLASALKMDPVAAQYFEAFAPTRKKPILWWVYSAKKPETRAARVAEIVRLAHDNIKAR
jgi:uncharacterized protein YdeI (YjbR/CyaY-like superfamily)